MGGALFTAIAGGIILTGCLFHFGHPFLAIGTALAACAAVRWIWINYA